MRRAAKVDLNQTEIVQALRAIGASVYYIKEPVDLAVGFRKRTVLLEVKSDKGSLTASQKKFFSDYNGEAYIVFGVRDAIEAVTGKALKQ